MNYKIVLCLYLLYGIASSAQVPKKDTLSIYFSHNSFLLSSQNLSKIDSIKQFSKKENTILEIAGYTNAIGNRKHNLVLSENRALSVKRKFPEYTIRSAVGYGELPYNDASARRVDVILHRKPIPEILDAPKTDIIQPEFHSDMLPPNEAHIEKQPKTRTLNDLEVGDVFILQDILFYPGTDVIKKGSAPNLKKLYTYLKENEGIQIRILGHICCSKSRNPKRDGKNNRTGRRNLSKARAKAIYTYLKTQGIDKKRMSFVGMAFTQPTGKATIYDRRVEIEIISKGD